MIQVKKVRLTSIEEMFRDFASEIDKKLEKREIITRLSREITLESKKFIFTLQRYAKATDVSKLDKPVAQHLNILSNKLNEFSQELEGYERYFDKQVSMGIQEYIESICFYEFITAQRILEYSEISRFTMFPISVVDYLEGLLDFTGEIMRYGITSNQYSDLMLIHSIMSEIQTGMIYCSLYLKSDKLSTFEASFSKIQAALVDQTLAANEKI